MSERTLSRNALVLSTVPSKAPRTLLDVKYALPNVGGISGRRLADAISALNTLGQMHKLPGEKSPEMALSRMEADQRLLTKYFDRKPLALMGLKKASAYNLKSRVRYALNVTGAGPRLANRRRPLSPSWAALFSGLPQKPHQVQLTGFIRYLDTVGIAPKDVTSAHIQAFGNELELSGIRRNPRQTMLVARSAWNSAVRLFPDWPSTVLEVPLKRDHHYALPWSSFGPGLHDEVTRRTRAVLDPALDDLEVPSPVSERTAANNEYDIRRFASALSLQTGREPRLICSIADLVQPDAAVAILQFLTDRVREKAPNAKSSAGIDVAAQLLCTLAKNWVKVGPDDLHRLRLLSKRVAIAATGAAGRRNRRRGMAQKNREMLQAFRDEALVARFLDLPEAMFRKFLGRKTLRRVDAAQLSACFAIALLQIAPVRPKNGSGILLGKNLIEQGRDSARRVFVHWAPEEVKNGVELHFELTGTVLQLFDLYMERVRPALAGPENEYLFPGRGIVPKDSSWFSTQIASVINDELGVRVTGHQFRHLIAYLYLLEHPGDYETVRLFLGHTSLRTTTDFYAEMQMEDAAKILDAAITRRRAQLSDRARHNRDRSS